MSEVAGHRLCDNGAQGLIIINRTPLHAIDLAKRFGAIDRTFAELTTSLVEADVVISSTTAPHAIISYEMMQDVMQRRDGRSLLLIDIAMPRDIDPAVGDLAGGPLYYLDDLEGWGCEGIRLRFQEVEQVQAIIAEEENAFDRLLRSLSVGETTSDI